MDSEESDVNETFESKSNDAGATRRLVSPLIDKKTADYEFDETQRPNLYFSTSNTDFYVQRSTTDRCRYSCLEVRLLVFLRWL